MSPVPLKILHIEDSPTDSALFGALLKQVVEFDIAIDHVGQLADGISRVGEEKYDAVVLDLGLPDSFGIGTYDQMRKHAPSVPIIIVTGNDDREMLAEAMSKGADNYLIKDAFDGNRIAVAILAAMRARP
jgi:Response regulator containing a CheY-like receiver domain and an HTH DNA-binding domain